MMGPLFPEAEHAERWRSWVAKLHQEPGAGWGDGAPYELLDVCYVCRGEFSLFSKGNHCRCCGRTVCQSHSAHEQLLPPMHINQPVRVCDNCVLAPAGPAWLCEPEPESRHHEPSSSPKTTSELPDYSPNIGGSSSSTSTPTQEQDEAAVYEDKWDE